MCVGKSRKGRILNDVRGTGVTLLILPCAAYSRLMK